MAGLPLAVLYSPPRSTFPSAPSIVPMFDFQRHKKADCEGAVNHGSVSSDIYPLRNTPPAGKMAERRFDVNALIILAIWFVICFPLGVFAGLFLHFSDKRAESQSAAMLSEQAARKLAFVELIRAQQQVERLNRSTGELTLISMDEALGELRGCHPEPLELLIQRVTLPTEGAYFRLHVERSYAN